MPTSLSRRLLLSIAAVSKVALILTALAVGLFIGKGTGVVEATYDPTITYNLDGSSTRAGADDAADSLTILDIAAPDYNFGAYITLPPRTRRSRRERSATSRGR
jgi:hypothetical protein